MCGIFAYLGEKTNAGELILQGLTSLEYRGYDSWGVAIKKENSKLHVEKHPGKIGEATFPPFTASSGIGHTRWATHGGVTAANAHPHVSCNDEVVLVHNGIVENFEELKQNLQKAGHHFKSETDSEVIAHLLEEEMKNETDLKEVVLRVFRMLTGMSAIIVFFPGTNQFFAIKNGSPLVYSGTQSEQILASDAVALIPYTNNVFFLPDYELLEMNPHGARLYDETGTEKSLKTVTLEIDKSQVEKGAFAHFMIKEIHEQAAIVKQLTKKTDQIQNLATAIQKSNRFYFVGCGSAYYAALCGEYLFSKIAKIHANSSFGSEFSYHLDFIDNTSTVMAVSQSGETIDIISGLQKAREKGAHIMALVNVLGSTLYRTADSSFLLGAGPEKAVCSTKAFVAQITAIFLLAHTMAHTVDKGTKDLFNAAREITSILEREKSIQELAEKIVKSKNIFVLGRGISYPGALESALKIKEVCYIHAEGFAGGELKHGVIALIEKGTPVIIYNPEDETYEDSLSSAYEVKARGAYVIGISSKPNPVFDAYIEVKNCGEATIIPNVVIAQLLGYYLALAKNLDPDKPRNLAKSVTVK
ncbi:glutamine--fructose-6-phosphate transaminase (isomerizing) [Candidatus Roizmanbacteria bacterium]|nr:glutamine--fructose-6-phosphate transaminase (isomerizing) [Candidatus Roizmanbacteria bacterium]